MTIRPCLDCGILTDRTRCLACGKRAAKTKPRPTTTQRGYGRHHQRLRAMWQARMVAGEVVVCPRCGHVVDPAAPWDLGHNDDRSAWTGPEHATCNRVAGGRSTHHRPVF